MMLDWFSESWIFRLSNLHDWPLFWRRAYLILLPISLSLTMIYVAVFVTIAIPIIFMDMIYAIWKRKCDE